MKKLVVRLWLAGRNSKPETYLAAQNDENEYDPEKWGDAYPLHYESWLKTKESKPVDKSRYKRRWDTDEVVFDKLSEFPFLRVLYS